MRADVLGGARGARDVPLAVGQGQRELRADRVIRVPDSSFHARKMQTICRLARDRMGAITGFIGSVVTGSFRQEGSRIVPAKCTSLGTGFIVDPKTGTFLTCEHVFPRVDRDSDKDYALCVLDTENRYSAHIIDKSFYEQWE